MTPVLPAPTADELAVIRARIEARHWPRHQLPWGARAQRIPGRRPLWLVTVLLGILTVVVPLRSGCHDNRADAPTPHGLRGAGGGPQLCRTDAEWSSTSPYAPGSSPRSGFDWV